MILITGAARSGTSLTTQILQAMGCYLGRREDINSLYENISIRQEVLKPYLSSIGCDPRGQDNLPPRSGIPLQPTLAAKVKQRFSDGPEPWAYKDAKLTLVWPVWHDAFPDAKWVIVRRRAERIADSCIRTPFMTHHGNNKDAWMRWVKEHEVRFDDMRHAVNYVQVWTDDYVADPLAFKPVADFLGLNFSEQPILNLIRRRMWHG